MMRHSKEERDRLRTGFTGVLAVCDADSTFHQDALVVLSLLDDLDEMEGRVATASRNTQSMATTLSKWQDDAREALGEHGLGATVPTLIRELRTRADAAERERDFLFDALNMHMRSTGITKEAMERVDAFRAVIAQCEPMVRGEFHRLEDGWREAARERDEARAAVVRCTDARARAEAAEASAAEREADARRVLGDFQQCKADLAAAQEIGCIRSDHAHCARVTRERDEKHAALVRVNAEAAALRESLAEGVALLEVDEEANTPGTDSFTWLHTAREALTTYAGERLLKERDRLHEDVRNLQGEDWRKEYEAQIARDGASIIILQMAIREYIDADGSINKDGLYAAMKQTGAAIE